MFVKSTLPLVLFVQLALGVAAYPQFPPNVGPVGQTTTTTTTTTAVAAPTSALPKPPSFLPTPPAGVLPRQVRNADYGFQSGSTGAAPAPTATSGPQAVANRRRQVSASQATPKVPSTPFPPEVANVASITNSTSVAAHGSKREAYPGSFVFGSLRFARADAPQTPNVTDTAEGVPGVVTSKVLPRQAPQAPDVVGTVSGVPDKAKANTSKVPRQAPTEVITGASKKVQPAPSVIPRDQHVTSPTGRARPMEEVPKGSRVSGRQAPAPPAPAPPAPVNAAAGIPSTVTSKVSGH